MRASMAAKSKLIGLIVRRHKDELQTLPNHNSKVKLIGRVVETVTLYLHEHIAATNEYVAKMRIVCANAGKK